MILTIILLVFLGKPLIGSEFQEVLQFGSDITPLFPVTHASPAANPLIDCRDWTVIF